MAKRTIIVSDLSDVEVPEGEGALVRVTYFGSEKGRELHITKQEADELLAGGREFTKRGRKAGSTNGTPAAAPAEAGKK